MVRESGLTNYLKVIQNQWQQVRNAFPADDSGSETTRAELPKANCATLNTLYATALDEVTHLDQLLRRRAMKGLELLHRRHKKLIEEAWYLWKKKAYYTDRDNALSAAWNKAEAALSEFGFILPAVNALAADSETSVPPQLTDKARAVLELLSSQPSGKGLDGGAIRRKLKTREQDRLTITQAVLTSHIMPILKQHYGVKNKRGLGYYVQK